jgi:NAD(P)-dependent dehydrogenase (short-subunit alcohol dehydrogenase family)
MINPLDLSGRTVLVTGASSGIGRCTAILLSRLGAQVILTGRNKHRLEETAASLEGPHLAEAFDLSDPASISGWLSRLVVTTGPLNGLVHCAGVDSLVPLRALSISLLEKVMRINFEAAAVLTKEFSRRQIHKPGASIVLVASVAGLVGVHGKPAYSASKGALIAFAKSAALELARLGLRVNCVAPAYVRTEMYDAAVAALTPEQVDKLASAQPLGLGDPMDVAYSIAFLLAETARWITGTVLTVDGGHTAQ